eukprot:TRINITY_DN57422_c0_g1_i1.p1 TRINITY_DN57422_c0_g1~~TRINITY_DN57422_c0_g1_i1.p1  ORF type:complete len:741 (-),score=141.99 TRINITY_DN57422_c0_g1_i1:910-3132(-)
MPADTDPRWQDASQCSTGLLDSDGGSFSAWHSLEQQQQTVSMEDSGLSGGSFTERGSPKRKPLLLLQLQRMAPPGVSGGITSRQDRSYDVLVEPGANPPLAWLQRVRETASTKAWVEPGGLVPWIPTLRGMSSPKVPQRPKSESPRKPTWRTGRFKAVPMALPGLHNSCPSPSKGSRDSAKSPASISGLSTRPGTCVGSTRPGTSAGSTRPGTCAGGTRPGTSAGDSQSGPNLGSSSRNMQQSLAEDFSLIGPPGATGNQSDRQELGPSSEQRPHSGEQQRSETLNVGEQHFPKVDSTTKCSNISTSSSSIPSSGGSKRARGKHVTKEPEVFEMTNKGMKAQPNAMNQRIRNQIKDLGSTMVKTMTQTFSRDIWDACEVLHPEKELERARALAKLDELAEAERMAEKIKGLNFGFEADLEKDKVERIRIPRLEETEETRRQMQEERALAWLARQTGWSVLDVEEVREVFMKYSLNGTVTVGGMEFVNMVQEIYHDCSADDVKLLNQQIVGVRRRSIGWRHRSRFDHSQTQDRSEVRFSEFYLALVKWLAIQQTRDVAKDESKLKKQNRISLSRYSACDEDQVTSTMAQLLGLKPTEEKAEQKKKGMVNDLAEFRKLKKEIKEEILAGGPKDGLFERQRKQRQLANAIGRKRGFLKRNDDSDSDVSELSGQRSDGEGSEEEEDEDSSDMGEFSDDELAAFGNDSRNVAGSQPQEDDPGGFGLLLDGQQADNSAPRASAPLL